MTHASEYLQAVFYSLLDYPGMVVQSLAFTYTPTVKGRSIVAGLYAGQETRKALPGSHTYQAGIVLFECQGDQVHFLQKIPIHCMHCPAEHPPHIRGAMTHDGRWLLVDIRGVNDAGPNIIGYYNPMVTHQPLGTTWHVAVPKTDPYHYSPFGGTVRVDRTGRLIQID